MNKNINESQSLEFDKFKSISSGQDKIFKVKMNFLHPINCRLKKESNIKTLAQITKETLALAKATRFILPL
jgi:hypothetical protein